MEINVGRISKYDGASEQFEIVDEAEKYEIDFCGEKLTAVSPVIVKGNAVNYEGKIETNINVKTKVLRTCSRCLEDFIEDVDANAVYTFVRDTGDAQEDFISFNGDSIDITDLIVGQIAAGLTMKPLCKVDCKGLCPKCGVDRNLKSCTCKSEQVDSRMQVLSKLLDIERGGV